MKHWFSNMNSRRAKLLLIVLGVAALAFVLIWGFRAGRKEAASEQEEERPVQVPLRLSVENGRTVVTLDSTAQRRIGLEVATLEPAAGGDVLRAYGTVVDLQQLTDLYTRYTGARTQVDRAKAALEASRSEYERLHKLYEENQNVSAKAVQAARATMRADSASLEAARAPLRSIAATARQDWGPTLAEWMLRDTPQFERLLDRKDLLVQLTLPPGVALPKPPTHVPVQAGSGPRIRARFISVASRTNPSIQGQSFFYLIPASGTILPGMSVTGYFPRPGSATGARVPESAVVWSEGRAWVYEAVSPGRFARQAISTDVPASPDGYVVTALKPGSRIVTQGAQMLLSEELRAQIQVED